MAAVAAFQRKIQDEPVNINRIPGYFIAAYLSRAGVTLADSNSKLLYPPLLPWAFSFLSKILIYTDVTPARQNSRNLELLTHLHIH